MEVFDLELRVNTFGAVISWQVMLEDATDQNRRVLDWMQAPDGHRYKNLPGYQIQDQTLEVFACCNGIAGGYIECQLLIKDNLQSKTLMARVEEREYKKASYTI